MSYVEYERLAVPSALPVAPDKVLVGGRRYLKVRTMLVVKIGPEVLRGLVWRGLAERLKEKGTPELAVRVSFGEGTAVGKMKIEPAAGSSRAWRLVFSPKGHAQALVANYPEELDPRVGELGEAMHEIMPVVAGADNTRALILKLPACVLGGAGRAGSKPALAKS